MDNTDKPQWSAAAIAIIPVAAILVFAIYSLVTE
jgi:hypothetical protein